MGKPAIIKPWSPKFDFGAEILRTIPLWVKFPNLPLNCWGPETLSRIGSFLGIPICSDECTTRQLKVSFARVLIEIDVTKPLPKSVFVESPSKETLELKVVYEWTPPFCSKCNKVGHDCSVKALAAPKQSMTAAPKQSVNAAPKQSVTAAPKQSVTATPKSVQQVWVAKPTTPVVDVDVDASIHGQSIITPQVHTSQNSDEGWRIVGRNTKSQQTRVNQPASTSNAFVALFANEMDGVGGFTINPSGGEFIHCSVLSKDLSTQIHLTVIYGLHSIHDRLPMWEGIRNIYIKHYPWLFAGEFNSVLHTSDRLHGTDVTDYETRDFQSLVDDLDLIEVKSKGAFYSWSNKAHTGPRSLSKIDRAWCSGGSVWQKLNSVKSSIKSLNSKQFGNISEMIDQANVELAGIQNLMAQNPDDLDLYVKESDAIKNRQARNIIDSIFDSNQVFLKDPDAIFHEIISFYKSLLGTKAPWLPVVDLVTIRRGKQLSSISQSYLIQRVSHAEIVAALKGIDSTKAPGIDSFNSFFFKRAWHIVKDDIYASGIDFFTKGTLPKQWNCTTITLVITARLAAIIGKVIDDAQAGFIPGKHIGDNILLATELIKVYDHKFISPRCMVKVDLKKAYDSVEWGFLITVMQELGFPQRFITWILTCLTSISYSILINGFPAPSFEAKKGLRKGDPMSPFIFAIGMEYLSRCLDELRLTPDFNFHPRCEKLNLTHMMFADDLLMFSRADSVSVNLLFQAFLKFSGASGLSANLDKSEVYFGGVSIDVQAELKDLLGVSQGSIPFRYLGIPLSSKKLIIAQCRPLVEKVTARIQGWMAKHLSYARRLQLVKSVLFVFLTYWSQIFILPKKILKEIEARFRCFLWTGSSTTARKSLVAWNYVCLPKVCGGWNFPFLPEWNKAPVTKLLWDIAHKADNLWRNAVLFTGCCKPVDVLVKDIIFHSASRILVVVAVLKYAAAWVSVCCSLVCMELFLFRSCSVLAVCSDAATAVLQVCCSLGAGFVLLFWQLVFLSGLGSQNPS
ncbi:uncharacterized protein LOC110730423 [Chenopodium quinoa]|uniref:uncharacterized protein LOC110730423 n=1 Tax=Chenopodium quinoa TaxID=63459 RepID=UPI000B791895|nr:uncharacterized protein LOC110730423 [Chenopodium quinoa]